MDEESAGKLDDKDVTRGECGVGTAGVEELLECTSGLVILELSSCVRKAFVAHACWSYEEGDRTRCRGVFSELFRKESIAEGGKWILKGREDGYPPRTG